MPIPDDFPRDPFPGALPGAQPKLLARLIDGRYVVGLTDEELQQRYDACVDLIQRLVTYCIRKQSEYPSWSVQTILRRVYLGMQSKPGLCPAELRWIVDKVASDLGWPKLNDAALEA